MNTPQSPLVGPPPAEVPLSRSPLVRVIAQVRFPIIASIEKREFVAAFQEAIRAEYPVLRPEAGRVVSLPGMDARTPTVWRFHDPASDWRVALAPDFLALETGRYTSRDDFMARFRRVLQALETHVDPKMFDRLGIRYIDRIEEPHLEHLPSLVRPEVSGLLATDLYRDVRRAISETVFVLPDNSGLVTTRWGLIPSRSTIDPTSVEPIESPSWLLDVDAFRSFQGQPQALDIEATIAHARGFAERIYSIFRWAVTDDFLKRYGGQL